MTHSQAKQIPDALVKLIDARVDMICRDSIHEGVYYPRKMHSGDNEQESHRCFVKLLTETLQ